MYMPYLARGTGPVNPRAHLWVVTNPQPGIQCNKNSIPFGGAVRDVTLGGQSYSRGRGAKENAWPLPDV